MKVLELFAGTKSIGKEFLKKDHDVFSVDYDEKHKDINLYDDIMNLTVDRIIKLFGVPDVVWASPDCTTYSVASIYHHRPHNREHSDYAKYSDKVNIHLWSLINELLKLNEDMIYFVENPRGMYRKQSFVEGIPRFTVTYCQYGDNRMKPTDIFTNYLDPRFKPMCKNGDPCHDRAPRGSQTGTQGRKKIDRIRIPRELCSHIVDICEEVFK